MKKFSARYNIILVVLISSILVAGYAYGEKTSIKTVLTFPDRFNRRIIELEGEIIGELLKSDSGLWINISSQGYNTAVFISNPALAEGLKYWGSYREQGDVIKVKGTFYKDCSQHRTADIHASSIEIIKPGFIKREKLASYKVDLAIFLLIICLTLAVIYFIKEYKTKS
jgi:hypothetical protein